MLDRGEWSFSRENFFIRVGEERRFEVLGEVRRLIEVLVKRYYWLKDILGFGNEIEK